MPGPPNFQEKPEIWIWKTSHTNKRLLNQIWHVGHQIYEKIALSHSLCLFIWPTTVRRESCCWIKSCFFSLGLNFSIFSIGPDVQRQVCQKYSIHCAAPPRSLLTQVAGLSSKPSLAVAFSCLTQVWVPSLGIRPPVTGGCSRMKPQPPAPTQHSSAGPSQFQSSHGVGSSFAAAASQLGFSLCSALPPLQVRIPERSPVHCLHCISAFEPSSQESGLQYQAHQDLGESNLT